MIYREDLLLVRLPLLRLRFSRKKWKTVRRVRICVGIHTAHVDVVVVDEPTVRGGSRHWLRCTCGRTTSILGMSLETGAIGCRSCMHWRTRPRPVVPPHAAHASAGIVMHAEVPPG